MKIASVVAVLCAALPTLGVDLPLKTSSRWILDAGGNRVKLRCVNWAGHLEVNTPEGLNKQSVDHIADFVAAQGFNCVRLTYSIDHALNPNVLVSQSFTSAASAASVDVNAMNGMYAQVVEKNPFLASGTTRDAYAAVIAALWKRGVMTILDNHVSRASWCCNLTDGNGWWDQGSGYNKANSRFFNTQNWLNGLESMATWANSQPGVIGMGLRNEIREFLLQGTFNGRDDWYNYLSQAAKRVHQAGPDLLILIGGTQSSTDLTHIRTKGNIDWSAWADKHVWEWHAYEFTVTFALAKDNCSALKSAYGLFNGFVLEQGRDYTAPLILSEFGFSMTGGPNRGLSDAHNKYFQCLKEYVLSNDSEWAIWSLMGSYYLREGIFDHDEGYGVMDHDWVGLRNPDLPLLLEPMFQVTQGP
ncbi:putative cellulase family protein [Rosellinia necatrix]|uniref:Putative cellulase family protein n=1 Tax=Rosellinia necatrix TaxID=77044 RepID=A0A1W2TLI7_ROSNE|nr:putative cellulase family protein [Rosellinia necatrix]